MHQGGWMSEALDRISTGPEKGGRDDRLSRRQKGTDMAHKKVMNTGFPGEQKPSAAKHTLNPTGRPPATSQATANMGAPDKQHDPKRRGGSFEGAGDHARTGNPGHQ
jgi:hypothetical protein